MNVPYKNASNSYFDKVSVLNFALLAIDVYHNPQDHELLRNEFNPIWIKMDEWPRKSSLSHSYLNVGPGGMTQGNMNASRETDPKTGFYASFYKNIITGVGVIAIRGTDSLLDGIQDLNFARNLNVSQYEEACQFWHIIKNYYLITDSKKIYVCGHSLGGILAKMISPITGVDTIAFNSSGVMEYLTKHHLPNYKANSNQKIVTYCGNGDPVGNLNHVGDISEYKFVPIKGEAKMSDLFDKIEPERLSESISKIKEGYLHLNTSEKNDGYNSMPEFDKSAIKNKMTYHKMVDMYNALKNSDFYNDYI